MDCPEKRYYYYEELFGGSDKTYFDENLAVWKAMEEAVASGKIRSIGVSNFEISDIQNIIDHAKYDYQLGLLPLPRSTNPAHIAENKDIDFIISEDDMNRLSQIKEIQSLDM